MLRALAVTLLVANGLVFAWSRGWVPGLTPLGDTSNLHEPGRLGHQFQPERVTLVRPPGAAVLAAAGSAAVAAPPAAATSGLPGILAASGASATLAAAAASAGLPASAGSGAPAAADPRLASLPRSACLEAGPLTSAALAQTEGVLATQLPHGRWITQAHNASSVWLAYLGPFADADEAARKAAELRRLGVGYDEVRSPAALTPGLAFGRFNDALGAQMQLLEVQRHGVHTARIIEAIPARRIWSVRIADADPRLQLVLLGLRGQIPAPMTSCTSATTTVAAAGGAPQR